MKKVHRSKPRNPLIADVCFKGGYIDSWGRGTIKVIEACHEAGLPEPDLKEEQGGFLSKIYKDRLTEEQLKKMGLSERHIKVVLHLKSYRRITNQEYQKLFEVSRETATRDLGELTKTGILKSSGSKGAGSYYTIAP